MKFILKTDKIMEDKLLEIINTVLLNSGKEEIQKIKPDTNLRNDLGFSSLQLAELTVRIESEFGIDVFEDGIVNTISEIIEKLRK